MKHFLLLTFVLSVYICYAQPAMNKLEKAIQSKERMELFFNKLNSVADNHGTFNSEGNLPDNILKRASAKQKLDSVVTKALDSASGTLINDWKDEYTYNSKTELSVFWEKSWDTLKSAWEVEAKTEVENNSKGQPKNLLFYYSDDQTGELKPDRKGTVYYNSSDKTDSLVFMTLDKNKQWILDSRMVYHYNAAGRVEKMVILSMEEDEGEIVYTQMTFNYTYNTAGKITSSVLSMNIEGDDFVFSRNDFTWNGSGQLTAYETSVLNFFTFSVEKSAKTELQYNAAGDVSTETSFSWNKTTSAWVVSDKTDYTYGNSDASAVVFPNLLSIYLFDGTETIYNFKKIPTGSSYYEMKEGSFVLTERSTYYYSGSSTGISIPGEGSLAVYPNPFNDRLYFNWSGRYNELAVEIYKISGSRLIHQVVMSGGYVATESLPEGIYLYRVTHEGNAVQTGKLVRQR